MDSGFSNEDKSVYSKPLFGARQSAKEYKPSAENTATQNHEAVARYEEMRATKRFRPDKGFEGTSGAPVRRANIPVQFERGE